MISKTYIVEGLKKFDRAVNRFVQKSWIASVLSKFLWLIGLYTILQSLFGLPKFTDLVRYVTATSWDVEVSFLTLKGSVELKKSSTGEDSLVAWSESEALLPVRISNNVSQRLRIDSIRIYGGEENCIIETGLSVDKGSLSQYRDSYILESEEVVDITLSPTEIKRNETLLQSIVMGNQRVVVFTDRGKLELHPLSFRVLDSRGEALKEFKSN